MHTWSHDTKQTQTALWAERWVTNALLRKCFIKPAVRNIALPLSAPVFALCFGNSLRLLTRSTRIKSSLSVGIQRGNLVQWHNKLTPTTPNQCPSYYGRLLIDGCPVQHRDVRESPARHFQHLKCPSFNTSSEWNLDSADLLKGFLFGSINRPDNINTSPCALLENGTKTIDLCLF